MNLLSILLQAGEAVSESAAEATEAGKGFLGLSPGTMNILMIVLIFVVFYFFMIRPQQKKQKDLQEARSQMKVGDKVVLSSGIYGRIKEVKDNMFVIEIADNVKVKVDKSAVYKSSEDAA